MKKNNLYDLILVIISVLYNCFVYSFGRMFPDRAILVGNALDLKIPYVGFFIYFYISWYLFIVLIPYLISFYDKDRFHKYLTMIFISLTVSLVIYILFPTVMIRTNLDLLTNSFTDKVVKFIYGVGSVNACAPSLHVLLASGYMLPLIGTKKIPVWLKILGLLSGTLIILSTVLVKQHVLIDLVVAISINVVSWIVVCKFKLDRFLKKVVKW